MIKKVRKLISLGFTAATIYSLLPASQKAKIKGVLADAPEKVDAVLTKLKDQVRATD